MKKRKLLILSLLSGAILICTLVIATLFQTIPTVEVSSIDHTSSTIPVTQQATTPPSRSISKNSIHISDSQALAYYEQGLKLYYEREFVQALKLFNQALLIDPQCYEALNAKGATMAFQGEYDQGLASIQQALDLNPSFVYAHFNKGLANELAGRWNPAIAAYQTALQLDDRDTWSYYGIASIYGRLGNADKAVEYLQQAINLNSDVKEVARNERDFTPVRQDSRFQALVKP
ncbi:MAG: tetratricopeptide repeat protein [Bacillota bacterium]|nr:tetratricopeptide repeat protein [Bacillota bacterium]